VLDSYFHFGWLEYSAVTAGKLKARDTVLDLLWKSFSFNSLLKKKKVGHSLKVAEPESGTQQLLCWKSTDVEEMLCLHVRQYIEAHVWVEARSEQALKFLCDKHLWRTLHSLLVKAIDFNVAWHRCLYPFYITHSSRRKKH